MDFTKMPKTDLSRNDSSLDAQLDKDLSQLGKKIEVVESNGSGKRKMEDSFINENKSFLARKKQVKEIKNKKKEGVLISVQEASLLREADLDKKESSSTENRSEEKKEISEKNIVELSSENKQEKFENLKEKADQAFQKLLEKETEFQKTREKRGLFQKTQALFGIGKNTDGHINKEFEDSKKILEQLQEEYQNNYQEFANGMVAKKKETVQAGQPEQLREILRDYVLTEEVVKGKEKKEDGSEEEKMFSLLGYLNQNEKKLLQKRQEALSEKRQGILKTAWEKYNSLSKKEKMIYGVGISSAIGTTIMLAGGAAVGTALGYGAWKGGKTLLKRLAVGAVGGAVFSGVVKVSNKKADRIKSDYKEKRDEKIVSGFENNQGNLFETLSEYNKKEKRVDLTRKSVLVLTGVGLAGTALSMDGLASHLDGIGSLDESLSNDFSKEFKAEAVEIPGDKESADFGKVNLDKVSVDVEGEGNVDGNKIIVDKINEDKTGADIKKEEGLAGGENLKENYSAEAFEEGLKLNSHFELVKGGNVWNSLSEHFDGDRQEVGKVLAVFRAEMMKDLMENHRMNEVQANQFIEWRYRHMNIGTEFGLKDGKLEIPGFNDDEIITRFEGQNLSEVDELDSEKESFDDEKSTLSTSGEDLSATVDIPEPVETAEVLDPKISAQIDQNINNLVKDIYGRQSYEWDVMKDKNAWDIINGEYGNPIKKGADGLGYEVNEFIEPEQGASFNNGLDQAEINNRRQLNQVLLTLVQQSGGQPLSEETVEQFIRRVEVAHYSQTVSENISGNATVEVPDPTETVEIMDPDTSEQIEKIYGQQYSEWEAVKDKGAEDFVDNKYDDLKLNQVEIDRREKLRELLLDRIKETRKFPESGGNFGKPESVEEYLIRTGKN